MLNTPTIEWSTFRKVMMAAGTVVRVEPFPDARSPAYKIWVDFGPHGQLKTSAQVTDLYCPGDLVGRQVIGVLNLGEKQIGPFRSQFLLAGFATAGGIVLAGTERPVTNGTRLS
jgi:tRNA-binding protein